LGAYNVLLVEDEALNALYMASLLEAWGCKVSKATSKDRALELANAEPPDLVLMDITLGGTQDGIPAAEALREQFDVPIVYVTAHIDERTKARAQQTRPAAYLVKPFLASELAGAMKKALSIN
jgi:CheY-like chemotaxis protein